MSTHIFTTDEACKATCPPCTEQCDQGRNCSIAKRPKQFQPDYEIEHTKVSYTPTPLASCLGIFSVVMLVILAIRNA